MSSLHQGLAHRARRVVVFQVVLVLLTAGGFLFFKGSLAAVAAIYGGAVSAVITLLLSYSVRQASELAVSNPKASMGALYAGAVQRFVAVLVLLGIGIAALGLNPMALFSGFVVGQAGYFLNVHQMKKKDNGS